MGVKAEKSPLEGYTKKGDWHYKRADDKIYVRYGIAGLSGESTPTIIPCNPDTRVEVIGTGLKVIDSNSNKVYLYYANQ